MSDDGFTFGISDVARFLGKSPVTLRKWEQTGFYTFPRDDAGDRKLDVEGLEAVAHHARAGNRIGSLRYADILCVTAALRSIEKRNR